jgi:TolB-like protein/DNA-binding winged helix-turn-helix (wHTH) protein/Tfp pilus assembly protein PilF
MSLASKHFYRFEDFTVDSDQKVLLRHGTPLSLTPKVFETLLILIENSGRIVKKEELMNRLWPDTFVEEANLTSNILQLRKSLGDNARQPLYIETVAKRGYRFIAPVAAEQQNGSVNGDDSNDDARSRRITAFEGTESAATQPNRAKGSETLFRLSGSPWVAFVGITIVLIAAMGAALLRSRFLARPEPPNGRVMLAVLPFKNLTGDAAQDYFSDGLTEEMITQLGNLDTSHLGVIARTSVMHYKSSEEPLDRIGRELGVQYVLEGSVRRESDKVRITAQLIKVADQTHLWAREYDRELSHLLSLQGEIAQEVADEIRLRLADKKLTEPAPRTSSSPTYEAYDLYLKGQYFWNKRTPQGFRQAVDYFQQAANRDPAYARAYAGLANSYALMGGYSGEPQAEFISKARSAALRGLQLDENLAEAHTALALIVQNYDWDWQSAEKEYRRAIELNPNYATAHHWYAEQLALLGHFDEALRESERARELDPLSLIIATDNGTILYFSRQYDRAIEKLRAVLEVDPNFLHAHILAFVYVQKGMFADAQADLEKWRRVDDTPWSLAQSAYVFGRSGQQAEARRALEKLEQLNRRHQIDPAPILIAYVGMGNKDEALAWLEKAYSQHSNVLTTLKVDPAFDPLRSDPRFQDLLRRVGLAQ